MKIKRDTEIVNSAGRVIETEEERREITVDQLFKCMVDHNIDEYRSTLTQTTNPNGKPVVVRETFIKRDSVNIMRTENVAKQAEERKKINKDTLKDI